MKRILALFWARNLEFIRDRGALTWNIIFPVFLVVGISLAFNGHTDLFRIGYVGEKADSAHLKLIDMPSIEWVKLKDWNKGLIQLQQHQLHLLYKDQPEPEYWVNTLSPQGQFLDEMLNDKPIKRHQLTNKKLRVIDWILPGILAINMMYSSLYGVGYVIVRYRKNGYLKRLQATPLTAIEFMLSQLGSRLILSQIVITFLFLGCYWLLKPTLVGSFALLLLISVLGAFALIALGLVLCSRVMSEELSRGLLEMSAWPMLLLSEAWFSLDQAHPVLQWISKALPLTYLIHAWREVMYYGATLSDVAPDLIFLALFGGVCLLIGAMTFKWHSNQ